MSEPQSFGFTPDGGRRIVNAVRKVEGRVHAEVGKGRRWPIDGDGTGSSSTSGARIMFTISNLVADINCPAGKAIATVTHVSSGATNPIIGDEVTVCDSLGCFLLGPAALLAGSSGFAEQFTPRDCTDSYREVWNIYQLCGANSVC